MAARQRSLKTEQELSERQRYWLGHLREAEAKGEPLKAYAKRLGLSESSLYEAKRRLRAYGVIAAAAKGPSPSPGFARVAIREPRHALGSLRVRLASGALLEWSQAPQGDGLRELIDLLS